MRAKERRRKRRRSEGRGNRARSVLKYGRAGESNFSPHALHRARATCSEQASPELLDHLSLALLVLRDDLKCEVEEFLRFRVHGDGIVAQ